jgi:hypothetical protein
VQTPIDRFIAKVDGYGSPDECWTWTACMNRAGYGLFSDGRVYLAHRWSFEEFVGPIPNGLVIDHLCRTRACVNPAHMQTVTPRTNILRGVGAGALNAAKTHCPKGHPYDEVNTLYQGIDGRRCATCQRPTGRSLAAARERMRVAVELRDAGSSYHEIAEVLGYAHADSASGVVRKARAQLAHNERSTT